MRIISLEFAPNGKTYKIKFTHDCAGGRVVTETLPSCIWYVTSFEPLSIKPTISCSHCQLRGWFREGKWVDAPILDAGRSA